jgi:hypothetical protein
LGTAWKDLSPETRAQINEKRKHKYRQLPEAEKAVIQEASKARYTKVAKPDKFYLTKDDGKQVVLDDPEMVQWLNRLNLNVRRKKAKFQNRIERIQAWRDAGGLYPSPNIQDKMEITELFAKIAHILGRRCCQCGDWKVFDWSWRITRKDDFLAFVHFTKRDYERVLQQPSDYCMYCIRCTFDLRIFTFSWLFSPYSNRNSACTVSNDIGGERYANWRIIWPAMYPHDTELFRRIRQGYIKSLTCGIRGPDGNFLPTFLRKSQYYGWVGLQPRDLHPIVMARVAAEYSRLNPSTDTDFWGIGRDFNRDNKSDIDITDGLKRFLKEIPPGWQKQRNQNPQASPSQSPQSPEPLTTLVPPTPASTVALIGSCSTGSR